MARGRYIAKRDILPDIKYSDKIVSKFINIMMGKGKKSVAQKIFYSAMDNISEKLNKDPVEVFKSAIKNVSPIVEVKSRRVGGATYQVPIEVTEDRGTALAMKWIVTYSRDRSDKTMSLRLTAEIIDAFNGTGNSFKKKDDTHKMAEANKAFSHFRW